LKILLIWGNQINDISSLAELTHLTELGLGKNRIQDISPIAGATQLSVLHLDRNRINDISQIEQFTGLTSLKVSENPIQNMEPLRKLLKQIPDLELDIPAPAELVIQPPHTNK